MHEQFHRAVPGAPRVVLAVLLAGALALGATLAIGAAFAEPAAADTAGTVHFVRIAESGFDQFTGEPTSATQEWIASHMWRMVVWSPYFDYKTGWYPNGWVYDDAYAIYRGSARAGAHSEWILKDAAGNPLYIPSGCSGGTCPQYAGDIGDPAFRHAWIEELKAEIAHGYRGVFIDDVNMDMQVCDGNEEHVTPIDPATGQPMTSEAWRGYMANFMKEVRAQLPNIEIVHNAIWFADEHAGTANASIRSETESANYIFLERGANDAGLTGGEGQWSLRALLSYVDQVHALGRGVIMDGTSSEPQGLTYNLASYLLVSDGNDAVSGGDQTPDDWWSGWNVNLGEASGPRYTWGRLLRRDFSDGMVLVNPPGEPAETVTLPTPMRDAEGATVTTVTLPPASGAILTGTPSASTALGGEPVAELPGEAPAPRSGGGSTGGSGSSGDGSSSGGGAGEAPTAPTAGSGPQAYIGHDAAHPALPPAHRRRRRASHTRSGERPDAARVGGDAVLARSANRPAGHRRARAARPAPRDRPAR
jgi:Hypothetical glycosyl hydrolase family 15